MCTLLHQTVSSESKFIPSWECAGGGSLSPILVSLTKVPFEDCTAPKVLQYFFLQWMLTKVLCVWVEAIQVIGFKLDPKPLSSQPLGYPWLCQIWFLFRVDFLPGDQQGQPCYLPLEEPPFILPCLSTHICLYNYICICTYFPNIETILIIYTWRSSGLCKSIIKIYISNRKKVVDGFIHQYILRCLCYQEKKILYFWGPRKNIRSFMTTVCTDSP